MIMTINLMIISIAISNDQDGKIMIISKIDERLYLPDDIPTHMRREYMPLVET